ncbi:MAG TPA: hypothetical protein VLI90_20310 [Tepidisphaeraceae bacterium]|nr:hypothetical protein [Tepidisphaeraceae bacterium]
MSLKSFCSFALKVIAALAASTSQYRTQLSCWLRFPERDRIAQLGAEVRSFPVTRYRDYLILYRQISQGVEVLRGCIAHEICRDSSSDSAIAWC